MLPRQPQVFEKQLSIWSQEYKQLTLNEKNQIAQYLKENWQKMGFKTRVAEYALRLNITNDDIIKKTIEEFNKFYITNQYIDHNQLLDLLILSLRVLNAQAQQDVQFHERLGYLALKLQSFINDKNIQEKYIQYCTIMKLYKKIRNDVKVDNLEQLFNQATACFHKNTSFSQFNSRDTNIIITCLENLLTDQGTLEIDNSLIKDIISQAVSHLIQIDGIQDLDNLSLMSLTTSFSAEGQQKYLLFQKIINHIHTKLPEESSKERFLIGTLYHIFIKQKHQDISQLYDLLNRIKNFTSNDWDYCAHLSLINRLGLEQSLALLVSQKDIILSYKTTSPKAKQRLDKIRIYMARKFQNNTNEVVESVINHLKSQM